MRPNLLDHVADAADLEAAARLEVLELEPHWGLDAAREEGTLNERRLNVQWLAAGQHMGRVIR